MDNTLWSHKTGGVYLALSQRKLGVEEWIVQLVQGLYANAQSRVRAGEGFSQKFEVKVESTRDPYSVPCSSSLCWRPCHVFRAGVLW